MILVIKCGDVHKFEKLNDLPNNIFSLNFYQDNDKWKHKLLPIEFSKSDSDRVIDLLIYENHYALIKKINCHFKKSSQKLHL